MQYYVTFKNNGNISGFYVDTINGANIPSEAVPITIEDWQTYSADARLYRLDADSITIRLKTQVELDEESAAQPPAQKTPEQERVDQLEAQLTQQSTDNTAFMEFVLQTLGV